MEEFLTKHLSPVLACMCCQLLPDVITAKILAEPVQIIQPILLDDDYVAAHQCMRRIL